MRSFQKVLAAGLLIALAAAACSARSDPGTAAAALPSAVPTSSPESTPSPPNRPVFPSPTPTPEPIPTPAGPPGSETPRYLVEVQRPSSDLVAVDYAAIETNVDIPYFPGPPLDEHRALPGFTPDGRHAWVPLSDPANRSTSGDLPNDDAQITPFSSLTSGGLGPLRLGATVSEVNRRFGWGLEVDSFDQEPVEGHCVWINGPSVSGISMIGSALPGGDAEITRIYIWAGPWHTPSGLRLGSTDQNVADALGDKLTRQPHEYTQGDYLDFVPTDPDDPNGVRFETDTQVVDAISVGRLDWIELVEGCA